MSCKFSDVQAILDAVLARSGWAVGQPLPLFPQPHGAFWRQTGTYDQDYTSFTTGDVPGVGVPIMNRTLGQELTSNFYVILTNLNGIPEVPVRMPVGGPFITDPGYTAIVSGTEMTGRQIQDALAHWLTHGFPK